MAAPIVKQGEYSATFVVDERQPKASDFEQRGPRKRISRAEYLKRAGLTEAEADEAYRLGLLPEFQRVVRTRFGFANSVYELQCEEALGMEHLAAWRALAARVMKGRS